MAYTKQTWQDLPSKTTPINASRLGHIEQGIYDAASTADTAASNASSALSGLDDKVDKITGKGLSTNDFTDALKTKLDNIETGAEVNVQADYAQTNTAAEDYIKNKPTLGTSAYKNSTSVVTSSTDLVESGAVCRAIGIDFKNLLPNNAVSITTKGITFTVNSDGSVIANGTCTQNVDFYYSGSADSLIPLGNIQNGDILNGCTGGSANTYSIVAGNLSSGYGTCTDGDVALTNIESGIRVVIRVKQGATLNNVVFKPMIRKADVTDATYEPYHASVKDTLRDAEVVEGKNLIPLTMEVLLQANTNGTWNGDNYTIRGITFTVNRDSSGRVLSIKASGTATGGAATMYLFPTSGFSMPNGSYILSGGVNSNVRVFFYNGTTWYNADPNEVEFNIIGSESTLSCAVTVQNGTAVSNAMFYPMIRKTTETDPTYEPYYVPLKDVVPTKADNSVIGTVEDGATASQAYAVGSHAIRNGKFITWKNAKAQGETINDASDYTSGDVADYLTDMLKEKAGSLTRYTNTVNFEHPIVYECGLTATVSARIIKSDGLAVGWNNLATISGIKSSEARDIRFAGVYTDTASGSPTIPYLCKLYNNVIAVYSNVAVSEAVKIDFIVNY